MIIPSEHIQTEDGKHILRTSDRLTWKKCRLQHYFGSVVHRNLIPLRPSKPLQFGTNWHAGMAVLYDPDTWHLVNNPETRGAILEAVRQTFVRANAADMKALGDPATGYVDEEVRLDYKEREELGLGMLDGYFLWHLERDDFTPKFVEVDFEVSVQKPDGTDYLCDWCGAPVVYQGRLDGIVQDKFGWYWILEHKTAAQSGDTEHLQLDEQTGSYMWAVRRMLGIRVQGVIYNEAFKKVAHPPQRLLRTREGRNFSVNKQADTTYEIALRTLSEEGENLSLYEDYLEFLRIQGNKFFRRSQVPRNEHELRIQGERIYYEARELLNPETVVYPNPSRFNCMQCAFRAPCVAMNDGSDYEFLLSEDYRPRTEVEINARRAR